MGRRTYTYDGTEWVGLTSTTADLSNYANLTTTPVSGFRNVIINGKFDIWQRGNSATGAYTNSYVSDRWTTVSNYGITTYNYTKTSATDIILLNAGISNYIAFSNITHNGGDTLQYLEQRIENVSTLSGNTVTLSFYAMASSSTSFTPRFIQNFGTGGSTSITTAAPSITLSNSWARYSVTVSLPSIIGKTIGANSYLGVDVISLPNTISVNLTGVQLELGSIATPFEQRPIGTELALCQRYYWRWVSSNSGDVFSSVYQPANTPFYLHLPTPVQMRTRPTGASVSGAGTWSLINSVATPTVYDRGTNWIILQSTVNSGIGNANQSAYYSINGTSVIQVDAEL